MANMMTLEEIEAKLAEAKEKGSAFSINFYQIMLDTRHKLIASTEALKAIATTEAERKQALKELSDNNPLFKGIDQYLG